MKSYQVSVALYERVNYGEIIVTANSEEEAEQKAITMAIKDYEYHFNDIQYYAKVSDTEELDDIYQEEINWFD